MSPLRFEKDPTPSGKIFCEKEAEGLSPPSKTASQKNIPDETRYKNEVLPSADPPSLIVTMELW